MAKGLLMTVVPLLTILTASVRMSTLTFIFTHPVGHDKKYMTCLVGLDEKYTACLKAYEGQWRIQCKRMETERKWEQIMGRHARNNALATSTGPYSK